MKKLVLLLGILLCGNLFAAMAEEESPRVLTSRPTPLLNELPLELLEKIFYYLPPRNRGAFRESCRSMNLPRSTSFTLYLGRGTTRDGQPYFDRIPESETPHMVEFLKRHEHVVSLDIVGLSSPIFARALEILGPEFTFSDLKHLDLPYHSSTDIRDFLVLVGNRLPKLCSLNLKCSEITPDAMQEISGVLSRFTIKDLKVYNNKIGDSGATALSESLVHLADLNVESNAIGSIGAQALARLPLERLNISGNPIGDEGIRPIKLHPYVKTTKQHFLRREWSSFLL